MMKLLLSLFPSGIDQILFYEEWKDFTPVFTVFVPFLSAAFFVLSA